MEEESSDVTANLDSGSNLEEVDAIIIFHHEWEALRNCAESYRSIYPNGQLFIARDNLQMKHHDRLAAYNPKFINTYSTTEFFIKMKFNGENLEDISNEEFLTKLSQDFARMEETLAQCRNKYLLYLEADSMVVSKTIIKQNFDMDTLVANLVRR